MRVIKCDYCKKAIKSDREVVETRIGLRTRAELCKVCGKFVYDSLAKMHLLHESDLDISKK